MKELYFIGILWSVIAALTIILIVTLPATAQPLAKGDVCYINDTKATITRVSPSRTLISALTHDGQRLIVNSWEVDCDEE